jgi:predicted membrane protein
MLATASAVRHSITYEVVELPERHLCTDVLAHSDERHGNDSERLVGVILIDLFLLFVLTLLILILLFVFLFILVLILAGLNVLVAAMQHSLDAKNVASPCKSTCLDNDLGSLRQRVINDLQCLNRCIRLIL